MEWLALNWFWISPIAVPLVLGGLKLIAKKTKNVKDDKVITLLWEWWRMSRGILPFGKK